MLSLSSCDYAKSCALFPKFKNSIKLKKSQSQIIINNNINGIMSDIYYKKRHILNPKKLNFNQISKDF